MTSAPTHPARTRRALLHTALLFLIVVVCMTAVVCLARRMESRASEANLLPAEERLYIKGPAAKRMSLGFNALIADWYWMRSLQYVGRKSTKVERLRLDNLSELDLKLLAPLLDTAATLDPQFMAVYEYGAVVLPIVSDADRDEDSIALLQKGIAANPQAWRLYHHLGYIHWQRGDYKAASEAYGAGSRIAGAPSWMRNMEANMMAQGATPEFAREVYRRMHDETTDEQVKLFALYRLAQLDSVAERERINGVLSAARARSGRCPSSWRETTAQLRAAGLRMDSTGSPVDPTDAPYVLDQQNCEAQLHPESRIPRR